MMNVAEFQTRDFEVIYQDYYVDLCNYAFRYLKNKKTSEDVVSETFYVLWKNKNELSSVTNLKGYLYKSIYNNCLFFLRKDKSKLSIGEFGFQAFENASKPEKNALDKIILDELEEAIQKAVNKLPEQQAKVFRLKRFEDKKNKEVAAELKISIKTVEAHMSKAKQALKKELLHTYPLIIIGFFV